MSDLASQVSRAVTLQQLMKLEVEKLQERILDLESHNRTLATMIVPTLMKLHETIGRGREIERREKVIGESSNEAKGKPEVRESWSESPTTSVSLKSLKEKKIDCRIPRINYRLSRTKQHQPSEPTTTGGESSSPEPTSSSLEPTESSLKTNTTVTTGSPSTLTFTRISRKDSNSFSPRRLSPLFPKSKSSSTNIHSKTVGLPSPGQYKSSTFSGIPRMSSPYPPSTSRPQELSGESRRKVSPLPLPTTSSGFKRSSSSSSRSNTPATNNKNDSLKTPSHSHDLHNNSSTSRLPIRKNFSSSSSSSSGTKPKTNPGKVSSVIHHQNQNGKLGTTVGTNKMSPNSSLHVQTLLTTSLPNPCPTPLKTLGKDEGYSTMSSEALAEQEGTKLDSISSGDKNLPSTMLTKSNTFSTFHHHNHQEMRLPNGSVLGGSPQRKQLIMTCSETRRDWTSLPKNSILIPLPTSLSNNNVRIVRGIPTSYEIEDVEEGETMTIEEPSTSTILWEDSDDSDILFLPLEMSSGTSSPTLVQPMTGGTTMMTSTSRNSSVLPCSSSFSASSTTTNVSTIGSHEDRTLQHPLRRIRGEELVSLLTPLDTNQQVWIRGSELFKGNGEQDAVEIEERTLIEKWMRLEDVRNQIHWEDEWAWDWDGVERTYIKPLSSTYKKYPGDFDELEPWSYSKKLVQDRDKGHIESGGHGGTGTGTGTEVGGVSPTKIEIDSNTWTKSKKKKLISTQISSQNFDNVLRVTSDEVRRGNESKYTKKVPSHDDDKAELLVEKEKKQLITVGTLISVESGIVTEETPDVTALSLNMDDDDTPSPPPVIEFTPEFYRLVNYGSNSSVNDKELLITSKSLKLTPPISNISQKLLFHIESGDKDSSSTSSSDESPLGGKMDDKISQTDFGSSVENLSVSSELFTECRNCLELIKRLVGGIDESCGISTTSGVFHDKTPGDSTATLDRDRDNQRDELQTHNGAPTTWISLPKGLPTTEVDRIFEILSSSESEDILSPSSSKGKS